MSIIIFSRPIHSGKTTELLQWCSHKKNIYGILMPDINGHRKILDLNTKEVFDIECADPENSSEVLTSVGRFHFYNKAFDKTNSIILDALEKSPAWLLIDEAGKLELEQKGFYTAIQKAVPIYKNKELQGNLLITVRDSLCDEVTRFFKLGDARVIHSLEGIGK
jgi:nucleoside-triphosphatase THEP1